MNKMKKNSKHVQTLNKISDELKQIVSGDIELRKAILQRHGQGIIFQNTINVVQGKSGTHKSRLVELFCSCILSDNSYLVPNFLDYSKQEESVPYGLLYIDTERNLKDQFPSAIQRIKKWAGFEKGTAIKHFNYTSLIKTKRNERFTALQAYLEDYRQQCPHHLIIVLDVITDCTTSFNDVNNSLELIDLINEMINEHDVTFICVIHENPNQSNKARGHIGTEILNKASCQIQIAFDKDRNNQPTGILKITYLKMRMGKRPDPFYVHYCAKAKGLVIASPDLVRSAEQSKKQFAKTDNIIEALPKLLTQPKSKKVLLEALAQKFNCKERTIQDRIKNILDRQEVITDSKGQGCTLNKEKRGKEVFYSLVPQQTKLTLINSP